MNLVFRGAAALIRRVICGVFIFLATTSFAAHAEQSEELDLCDVVLTLSEKAHRDIEGQIKDRERCSRKIEEIASRVRKTRSETSTEQAIFELNRILFVEENIQPFTPNTIAPALSETPFSVLERRSGNCLGLSILYLLIAERAGMPLNGVLTPGHVFVRFEEDGQKMNIETTAKGLITRDDNAYITLFGAPTPGSGHYKNLTKNEVLGIFFQGLGNSYQKVNNVKKAEQYLERGIKLNPWLSEGLIGLGRIYFVTNRLDAAMDLFENAKLLNPRDFHAHFNLGISYGMKNNYKAAAAAYAQAVACPAPNDPISLGAAYYNWGLACARLGRMSEAIEKLEQALRLNPRDVGALQALRIARNQR